MDQIKTYAIHVHTTCVHNNMHIDLMCKQQLDIQQLNSDIKNMTINGGNYQNFTFTLLVFLCK